MFALQVALVKGSGGITTAVQHYARMFAELGVANCIVFRGPSLAALRAEGFDVLDAPPAITAPWRSLLPDTALRDAVRMRAKGAPLIAIVHSDLALGAVALALPEARLVAPCHSDKFKHKARADLVITLNAAQHESVSAGLAGAKTKVALLGNPYAPLPASPTRAPEGPPRINFCGRFIATKDPLALVAASRLMQTAPLPEFRFIGAGALEAEVRAAAGDLNATFPGWLSEPLTHFHRNDILVLPSFWEGLPYLLQEALDRGVAVIASDTPGNCAALADGAYGALYPLGDAAALAAAIDTALGDLDALRAKAEKGRAALAVRYGAAPFWRALTGALA